MVYPPSSRCFFRFTAIIALFFACLGDLSAAMLVVSNVNDSGIGSLRQAILDANNLPGSTISFQIPGNGPFTISPSLPFQNIFSPMTIDGTTQPGYVGKPLIELNGANAGSATHGFYVLSGNSKIKGLAINRFKGDAIRIEGLGNNIISGNFLGTDPSGINSLGNTGRGLTIYRSPNNTIGGVLAGSGNLISGQNARGISIEDPAATGNLIVGNFIGTDVTGTLARGNLENGIVIAGAIGNVIGGTNSASRNLVSGNSQSGIYLLGVGTSNNIVQGNYVGTDVSGKTALGNGRDGIVMSAAAFNTVGGSVSGAGNLISGNSERGVDLFANAIKNSVLGNFIGVDAAGTNALPNLLFGVTIEPGSSNQIGGLTVNSRNIISGNKRSGIFIGDVNSKGNIIQGNYIGTDVTGTKSIANLTNGISIMGVTASGNLIGGTNAGSKNLISGNGQNGIHISSSNALSNVVQGNYIGVSASGKSRLPNAANGVWIETSGNLIGGNISAARNVISGNTLHGMEIIGANATSNIVSGNFIGLDITGAAGLGNGLTGITITNASNNSIGGTASGSGNVISQNFDRGVVLDGSLCASNKVQGNFVGTDASGRVALGNFDGIGVYSAPYTVIGGAVPGAGNIISANANDGIFVTNAFGTIIQGNFIGTQIDGANTLGNGSFNVEISNMATNTTIGGGLSGAGNRIAFSRNALFAGLRVRPLASQCLIRGNSIFRNADLAIDLSPYGVTANDAGDADTGANGLQNYPVLTSASGRYITTISGTLNSTGSRQFIVDFYSNSPGATNTTGFGDGQTWLGYVTLSTDGGGNASFSATFTNAAPIDQFITATATDPNNNTSEFSHWVTVSAGVFIDSDGDGMSDEFEIANHLNPNTPLDALLDLDGDGLTNLQEYLAGSDPRDATSVLRLLPVERFGTSVRLSFPSLIGRTYRIEYSTNLPPVWNTLTGASSVPGTGFPIFITDPVGASNRFYRLRVQ